MTRTVEDGSPFGYPLTDAAGRSTPADADTRRPAEAGSHRPTLDHVCAAPASDEQLWEMSADFIAEGLAAGQQVDYFDDGTADHVLERLLDDGVELEACLEKGQLVVVPADVTRSTVLSPMEGMRAMLAGQVQEALDDGWTGLRITGQLNRALHRTDGMSMRAVDTVLDHTVRAGHVQVLCLYDRTHYPDDVIEAMRARHAGELEAPTIYDDNLLRITATELGRARIAGEVDHSNRPQVRRLLLDQLDAALRSPTAPNEITLDLSSLRFLDVSGAVGLVHAAEEFPSSHRLVLRGVRPRVMRVLDRCGAPFAGQLVVEGHHEIPVPRIGR